MNKEETKEAIKVMQAFVDGKEMECYSPTYLMWKAVPTPSWNFDAFSYRIKPTAILRPWTADEVPLGAWVRMKNLNMTRSMIVSVAAFNLGIAFKEYEHSTDGGKTWLPCGVMEEAK
jgi:hypothetical protein